jgi:hypothetical protein
MVGLPFVTPPEPLFPRIKIRQPVYGSPLQLIGIIISNPAERVKRLDVWTLLLREEDRRYREILIV